MQLSDGQPGLQELLADYIVFHQAQQVLLLGNGITALAGKLTSGQVNSNPAKNVQANAGNASSSAPCAVESLSANDVAGDLSLLKQMRWSVVVLIDDQMSVESVISVLSRVRDLHADRVLHVSTSIDWTISDSLALGFTQLVPDASKSHSADSRQFNLFEFDIHHYKGVPDWLNARHWANPELWGKHRW